MRTTLQKAFLLFLGLLISLSVSEAILLTGILDQNYIWVPGYAAEIDKQYNAEHYRFASRNPHRFNDTPRETDKPPGKKRVAIVGDSFIWGWGTRNREDIWSVKLARLIEQHDPSYEVLNWGRNGWATIEEFNFVKQYALSYGIDKLIVGFVSNDLDLTGSRAETLSWQKSILLYPIRYLFPRTLNFSSALINRVIEQHSTVLGYENWERRQYAKDNLKNYAALIEQFKNFCATNNINLIFVMTPNNHDPIFEKKFKIVESVFTNAGVTHLNLYPFVKASLGSVSNFELRVSRADGHPGPRLTKLFAEECFNFLLKMAWL